jgi:endonuclease-3
MNKEYVNQFLTTIEEMFPDAHGELNYHNIYELIICVILSAQTTDVRVNIVTPELFKKYPSFNELKDASLDDVKELIKSVGLYATKAQNIINCAKMVVEEFNGIVPNNIDDLIKLPGVGRKTASIVLIEGYNIPAFPVDTHVSRVSKRLGFASINDDPVDVEAKCKKLFPSQKWRKLHHQMIFLGRYVCLARKPMCEKCALNSICPKKKYK